MRRSVAKHQEAVEQLLRECWASFPAPLLDDVGTSVPLTQALGRVLAQDLAAPVDLPPFANSQMDGYAIHVNPEQPHYIDSAASTTYTVGGVIAAGAAAQPLAAGAAAPIMTGAPLPEGANAVVPVEAARPPRFAAAGESVELPEPAAGTFVRDQGSDVVRGSVAIAAGTRLNAAHLGLASALGLDHINVRRQARALLITTGDEVLSPGDPVAAGGLPAGKIFDANGTLLRAALEEAGVTVLHTHMVNDDPSALLRLLETRVSQVPGVTNSQGGGAPWPSYDLVVSVGGVSAGAFEVVRQALSDAGPRVSMEFLSVALQPGGPQGLGSFRGVPFLAFPGNPVSAYISVELFLRPALWQLLGAPTPRPRVVATLEHAITSPADKLQLRRGVYSGPSFESAPSVREVGGASSHFLASLAHANALIEIPAGVTELQAGAKVEVLLL